MTTEVKKTSLIIEKKKKTNRKLKQSKNFIGTNQNEDVINEMEEET